MAKKFMDASTADLHGSINEEDGSALALGGSVRVLYDDSLPVAEIRDSVQKIKERLAELSIGDG